MDYFKVKDNEFYTFWDVSDKNVVEVYEISPNHFKQLHFVIFSTYKDIKGYCIVGMILFIFWRMLIELNIHYNYGFGYFILFPIVYHGFKSRLWYVM